MIAVGRYNKSLGAARRRNHNPTSKRSHDQPIIHNLTSTLDVSQMRSSVHQYEHATLLWPLFRQEVSRRQEPACHLTLRTFQRPRARLWPAANSTRQDA